MISRMPTGGASGPTTRLRVILREVHRRTRVLGAFPDGNSALMLVAARLRHIGGICWGTCRYLNLELLEEMDKGEVAA